MENAGPILEGVLVYMHDNGKTLMIHRTAKPDDFLYGKWVAPGGKREPGEGWEECAKRELK